MDKKFFKDCKGKKVKINYLDKQRESGAFGVVEKVGDGSIVLACEGFTLGVEYDKITMARIVDEGC